MILRVKVRVRVGINISKGIINEKDKLVKFNWATCLMCLIACGCLVEDRMLVWKWTLMLRAGTWCI